VLFTYKLPVATAYVPIFLKRSGLLFVFGPNVVRFSNGSMFVYGYAIASAWISQTSVKPSCFRKDTRNQNNLMSVNLRLYQFTLEVIAQSICNLITSFTDFIR